MCIHREVPADQITPVTAYAELARKGACLLESTVSGDGGRHSFIGIESIATFTATGQKSELKMGSTVESFDGDPYEILAALEKRFGLPAVGFITYDAIRCKEKIPAKHPDHFHLPDFFFQFYRSSLLFDHEKGIVTFRADSNEEIDRLMGQLLEGKKKLPLLNEKREIEATPDITDAEYCKIIEKAKKFVIAGDVFQIVPSRTGHPRRSASAHRAR